MQIDIIQLTNVSKTYAQDKKRIPALRDFSLCIPRGSFVSLMGPSGCGKSTVTKIIAGIDRLDAGTLVIEGVDCSASVPQSIQMRMGYVFQWHNLAEWRTVEGNLYLPLEMYGCKRDATWLARAEKYLDLVGLTKYRRVYPHELSGGMKQRVGIARALMAEPDVLVFDQPYGALDAITREILAITVSNALRAENKSMLMVTSSVDEAVRYSDYVCVMTSGPGRVKKILKTDVAQEQRARHDFWMEDEHLRLKREVIETINSADGGDGI